MKSLNWKILLAVSWLILVAGLVRVWGWQAYYYCPDEMIHLNIAGQPTLARVWTASRNQVHPPLLYLVYHLALKVSRNINWLRSVSLAAGLATMVVLFFLGRKAAGDLAGIVMAALAAVSYGNILLDQVVRHYSLLLFFLTLSLWFFISWHKAPQKIYLAGLAAAGLLAVATHYSGVIPLAGMGVAWLAFLAARKRPGREYLYLALTFLPTVAALGYFYLDHVYRLFSSGFYGDLQAGYLNDYYASSLVRFWTNLHELFGYLFLPPVSLPLLALAMAGLAVQWARGQKELTLAILATFAVSVILNLAKKYPLGGVRHSIYFFPLAALAVGAAAQWLWDWVTDGWPARRQKLVAGVGLAALLVAPLLMRSWFLKNDFLRRYQGQSWMEFPLTQRDYQHARQILLWQKTDEDIIVTTAQTSHYLIYESGREPRLTASGLRKINCWGRDFYFAPRMWGCERMDNFTKLVRMLRSQMDLTRVHGLWLFNLGWGPGFPEKLAKTNKLDAVGAKVYLLDQPQIQALIEPGK